MSSLGEKEIHREGVHGKDGLVVLRLLKIPHREEDALLRKALRRLHRGHLVQGLFHVQPGVFRVNRAVLL